LPKFTALGPTVTAARAGIPIVTNSAVKSAPPKMFLLRFSVLFIIILARQLSLRPEI